MKLTTQQIETFNRDGFFIARGALLESDLQPVIDELNELIETRANILFTQGKIDNLHKEAPFEKRYGLLFAQSKEIGDGLDIMHYRGKSIFEFLINKNLLELMESLLGPELVCNPIQHIRAKPPQNMEGSTGVSFHNAPWHQDAGVMMEEGEASNIVTVWIPIGDATQEMGCMEVIPGIVETGYLRHLKEGGTTIDPSFMPKSTPVVAECAKGDIVLMSRFTPHRSTPNYSDKCRWSLDLRYQPTGQHTGRTGHPEFIVRSHTNPNSEMHSHENWCELWEDAFDNPKGYVGHRSV